MKNLRQIGFAMHDLAATSGVSFPASAICDNDGKPLLSWRVAILPHIGEKSLYKEFHLDEPWDSPHNKTLIARMPSIFDPVGDVQSKTEPGTTYYKAFVGNGGILDPCEARPISQVTDGTVNTILAAEAHDPVVWTKPEDIKLGDAPSAPELGGAMFADGFYVVFADCLVRFVKRDIKPEVLRALITFDGGEPVNRDEL